MGILHTLITVLLLFKLMGLYILLEISFMEFCPQDSVLGQILLNIYLLHILNIISQFPLISVHPYEDDIQLNVKCTSDLNVATNIMFNSITSIHNCLSNISLSLNPNKTETIFLHLPSSKHTLTVPPFIMVEVMVSYIRIMLIIFVFISTVLYLLIATSQIFFALLTFILH